LDIYIFPAMHMLMGLLLNLVELTNDARLALLKYPKASVSEPNKNGRMIECTGIKFLRYARIALGTPVKGARLHCWFRPFASHTTMRNVTADWSVQCYS
jgi:hypothetical protein